MSNRVVIAGASGFLGTAIAQHLSNQGRTVLTVGRANADATWGDHNAISRTLDGADLLINLAGHTINNRLTDDNRAKILNSRIETTRELGEAMTRVAAPPQLWLNASSATVYRHSVDRPCTEADPADQSGFSEGVARAWEAAFEEPTLPETRRVAMRITVALGDGDATRLLFRLARLGLGGPQYDGPWLPHDRYRGIGVARGDAHARTPSRGHRTRGRQRFSWVHVDDVTGAIDHIEAHPEIAGPVNFGSPDPVTNIELMRALRETVGMPIGLPAWRWMLEPAMAVLGTESELVLKSRWVLPGVLEQTGYRFRYPELRGALAAAYSAVKSR